MNKQLLATFIWGIWFVGLQAQPTLTSVNLDPTPNTSTDPFYSWGFFGPGDLGVDGHSLFDLSAGTSDDFGIIPIGYSEEYFFGVSELGNVPGSSGTGTISFEIDLAGAGDLTSLSIDMGAMGEFEELDDFFHWEYSIDGIGPVRIFSAEPNDNVFHNYVLADGQTYTYNNPLEVEIIGGATVRLDNEMQTLTYNFPPGISGTTLVLNLNAGQTGGAEAYVFDNIVVTGTVGSLSLPINASGFDPITLPVEFGDFSARQVDQSIVLDWETLKEVNSDYMAIERSPNGIFFAEVGRVQGADFSEVAISYQFIDQKPLAGQNIYRIRQVDFDGSFSYSNIIEIQVKTPELFQLLPNLVVDKFTLQAAEVLDRNWALQLFSLNQALISSHQLLQGQKRAEFDVRDLPAGIYFLRAKSGPQQQVIKFVKQ
ncbi:MAG: T9SS type A sorting domain-containing protein [Bacteroidota bacterium]